MTKNILLFILISIFVLAFLSGCGNDIEITEEQPPDPIDLFYGAITLGYPADVMDALSGFGNSYRFGFRTSGSEAELAAAEYLYGEMLEIGLKNVVKESITVDSWEFSKAELSIELSFELPFEDEEGEVWTEIRTVDMAAYPAQCEYEEEEMTLIYAGKGTEADYEDIDAEGKLALIEVDQREDWRISWPAYQAKIKGAAAVIAVDASGYFQYGLDTLGVLDINGAIDGPAFSVTARDGDMLKELIEESENGEIAVNLTADSVITEDSTAYSVIGEIPGAGDEVIYMIAHYDGYFGGFDDNASGVGAVLGIAKALIDSDFVPQKTIRFILHPAEKWGGADPGCDFAVGACQTLSNHPEWAENAFALIDIDGGVTSNYALGIEISASREFMDFALEVGFNVEGSSLGDFDVIPADSSRTGDFLYARQGVPVMRSGFSGDEDKFEEVSHSNMDTREYFFNEDAILFTQKLFGTYVIELDRLMVKPLNYVILFEDLLDSIGASAPAGAEALEDAVYMAMDASKALSGKIEKSGDSWDPDEAVAFNTGLQRLSRSIHDALISTTLDGRIIFAHERYQTNVSAISAAVSSLRAGDAESALNHLSATDLNRFVGYFDEATYDHFTKQVPGNTELYEIISVIKSKSEQTEQQDYLPEMESLDIALISQQKFLKDAVGRMTKDVISMTKTIDRMAE